MVLAQLNQKYNSILSGMSYSLTCVVILALPEMFLQDKAYSYSLQQNDHSSDLQDTVCHHTYPPLGNSNRLGTQYIGFLFPDQALC